ncbi:MAG: CRTAC1 family protein, partial [Bacteroidetes bacterium]|nr:CRTAC1 family protein [Bacteroidota bacterium]
MRKIINIVFKGIAVFIIMLLSACQVKKKNAVLFEVLKSDQTGLNFANKLTPTPEFNMFKYMYFYNGAGVGAGDFNNDGLIDLFFSANQGDNKLFLNEGKLHFKDVTEQASIPQNHGWSTGVSVVDINNDGLLDIYICQVGNFESLHGKNQLLVCKGIKDGVPYYEDEAAQYGLDFSGFSTQAVFFDYDNDGDLDMFLLNHSVHQNGTFAPRSTFLGTYHPLSGDKLFRNDGNKFTDVTKESAINSSAISYGLGIVVSDINLDGWPDLYAGNDFHENDYLYINQKNGTFKDESETRMMHTSMYSMGVDAGDINNDGYPDIVSNDMLPSDPYMIRRSLGEDDYDIYNYKISVGYDYQYTRNNLQLNRRNGMFSEVGLYAGMYATDWSWSALWMDFDNDGWKDLFISNGIPKRMNDIDYVNFVSNSEIQEKLRVDSIADKDMALVNKFPEIKLPNKFFHNQHNASFKDMSASIKGELPTFSNGAIYADLDNDGDLDVVTNNVDEPALIYENKTTWQTSNHFVNLKLKGPDKNINALGAKVFLFSKEGIKSYENYPVHGFQSSMLVPLHIGIDSIKTDSAFLVWPDNTYQPLMFSKLDTTETLSYQRNLPLFDYSKITTYYQNYGRPFEDITDATKLLYKHEENPFQEFNREPLIPHMVSTEGPALAVADINHDGTDDV